MSYFHETPFDRHRNPDSAPDADWVLAGSLHADHDVTADLPRLRVPPPTKPHRPRWMLAAECCYIVIQASGFLMACWIMALGLPVMFVLLLTGGHLDMTFDLIGSMLGGFVGATPDRRYAFASDATWVLLALATVIAAWRLPRFLTAVTETLDARNQVS